MTSPRLSLITSPAECSFNGCTRPPAIGDRCDRHEQLRVSSAAYYAKEEAQENAAWDAADHTADRAVLLALAKGWDDTVSALTDAGMDPGAAVALLIRGAEAHCHPRSRASLVFLIPQLVEAVRAVDDLRLGLTDPAEVIGTCWGDRQEIAEDVLLTDVDLRLRVLTHGRNQ